MLLSMYASFLKQSNFFKCKQGIHWNRRTTSVFSLFKRDSFVDSEIWQEKCRCTCFLKVYSRQRSSFLEDRYAYAVLDVRQVYIELYACAYFCYKYTIDNVAPIEKTYVMIAIMSIYCTLRSYVSTRLRFSSNFYASLFGNWKIKIGKAFTSTAEQRQYSVYAERTVR